MSTFDAAIDELLEERQFKEAYDQQAAIIHVAQMIRHWRVDAGLTQAQLAELMRTKQAVISRLESSGNENMPNLETLIQIAHICGQRLLLGSEAINTPATESVTHRLGDHQEELIAF